MAWTQLDVITVNRRPADFREVRADALPPIGLWATPHIRKQAVQNPPQFSGTIAPIGIRTVYLRRYGKDELLEKVTSDENGYFEFRGIYSESYQYEYVIIDNDGTISQVFHIDNPAYSRYLGNPTVNDSTGILRGDP